MIAENVGGGQFGDEYFRVFNAPVVTATNGDVNGDGLDDIAFVYVFPRLCFP